MRLSWRSLKYIYTTTRPRALELHSPLFHQPVVLVKYRIPILIQHRVVIKSPKLVICPGGKVIIDHITAKTGAMAGAAGLGFKPGALSLARTVGAASNIIHICQYQNS